MKILNSGIGKFRLFPIGNPMDFSGFYRCIQTVFLQFSVKKNSDSSTNRIYIVLSILLCSSDFAKIIIRKTFELFYNFQSYTICLIVV